MTSDLDALVRTVTLSEAKRLVLSLAAEQSILLLAPPGVGKSEMVAQAAAEGGLECRSLLGTQIAPEDVSGIPHIVRERSVFCPPRVLLPEDDHPFCLFLDELPTCAPDVQKALYSLLLERRLGEHRLPKGSWVVAAGNRAQDHALVRSMSSALTNRTFIVHVRADASEWVRWACANDVRPEIVAFVSCCPEALARPVPKDGSPFSTPRAWVSLSRALALLDARRASTKALRVALVFGRVSCEDAATFCAVADEGKRLIHPPEAYVLRPELLPESGAARWLVLHALRGRVASGRLGRVSSARVAAFLAALPAEHRFALLVGLVEEWGRVGAGPALAASFREVGLP